MTQQHHSIDYVELDCPDLAAAKAFYGAAFGWEFNDYGPGPDYVGIRRPGGEGEIGGLNPAEPRGRRGALVLLWADTAARTVIEPRELPVGILTAAIGAPVFALLLARRRGGIA